MYQNLINLYDYYCRMMEEALWSFNGDKWDKYVEYKWLANSVKNELSRLSN